MIRELPPEYHQMIGKVYNDHLPKNDHVGAVNQIESGIEDISKKHGLSPSEKNTAKLTAYRSAYNQGLSGNHALKSYLNAWMDKIHEAPEKTDLLPHEQDNEHHINSLVKLDLVHGMKFDPALDGADKHDHDNLNYVLRHTMYGTHSAHAEIMLPEETARTVPARRFWESFYNTPKPHHVQTVKQITDPTVESVSFRNGVSGEPDHSAIPALKEHAHKTQAMVQNYLQLHGKPSDHIELFRAVRGPYAEQILNAKQQGKTLKIPMSSLASWTSNPDVAHEFSNIDDQGNKHSGPAQIIKTKVPISQLLSQRSFSPTPGLRANFVENEYVVHHPEGHLHVDSDNVIDAREHSYHTFKASPFAQSHYNKLLKSDRKAQFITALAMMGVPSNVAQTQHQPPTPAHVEQAKPESVQIHPELKPIKMIESSGNKNTNHPQVNYGLNAGTRAMGSVGVMPLTAIETLKADANLRSKYSEVAQLNYKTDHDKIHQFFKQKPDALKEVANAHWNRIRRQFPNDLNRAVYAWNQGITAAHKADPEVIQQHDYVQKYAKYKRLQDMQPKLEQKKGLDLKKAESNADLESVVGFEQIDKQSDQQKQVNEQIKEGRLENISNAGHFTHSSFIAHGDESSWLVKVEPSNRSQVKSTRATGFQTAKEQAFYDASLNVFGLNCVPEAVLGQADMKNEKKPAVAIRMLPPDFKLAAEVKDEDPRRYEAVAGQDIRNGNAHRMAAAMYVLGDVDGHGNNVMMNDAEIYYIDHGTSFQDSSFDPAVEPDYFVPYILRNSDFESSDSKDDKMKNLVKSTDDANELNKKWLASIAPTDLDISLKRFGIDSGPSKERLRQLKELVLEKHTPFDHQVNYLWVFGPNKESQI